MNVEADLKVRFYDVRTMDPFSAWLEGTRLSTAMRNMTWLWPACESIHFIGLALLIGGAGYFDLRLLGFMRSVPMAAPEAFMPWAIAGFAMNFATGIAFFVMAPHMYVLSAAWWAKVFFIVVAGMNAMFFETTLGTRVMLGPNDEHADVVQDCRRGVALLLVCGNVFRPDAAVHRYRQLARPTNHGVTKTRRKTFFKAPCCPCLRGSF